MKIYIVEKRIAFARGTKVFHSAHIDQSEAKDVAQELGMFADGQEKGVVQKVAVSTGRQFVMAL